MANNHPTWRRELRRLRKIVWMALIGALMAATPIFAGPISKPDSKNASPRLELYTAVIPDGTAESITANTNLADSGNNKEGLEIDIQDEAPLAASQGAANELGYDSVPAHRKAELNQRLKITGELLQRFGRAYDYRTTTLAKLSAALAALENKTPKK